MEDGGTFRYDATMHPRRINLGQRVVLVIAIGAVLYVGGSTWTGGAAATDQHWMSPYSSPAIATFTNVGPTPNSHAIEWKWLFMIAVWTAISTYLLRSRPRREPTAPPEDSSPTSGH
jgi:hypothetical protein